MEQATPGLLYAKSKKIWSEKILESDFPRDAWSPSFLVYENYKYLITNTGSVRNNPAVSPSGKHAKGLFT